MLDVVIALLPAAAAGVYFFGIRALTVMAFSVFCCVAFEGLWQKLTGQRVTLFDLSAVVTGLLLGMNLPVTIPYWTVMIGALFAIVIVKQFFGGLGYNFMNPALAARAFMVAAWPQAMTKWVPVGSGSVDAVSTATMLSGYMKDPPGYFDMFIGRMPGCIGEVSAMMLIIGGVYLIIRRVINPAIPVTFIAVVFAATSLAGEDGLMHILSGGLMLGAFFMATDYVTSPITWKGQIIMGLGCGVITSLIRLYGGYPEGVSYSILLMNIVTPLINRATIPKGRTGMAKPARNC